MAAPSRDPCSSNSVTKNAACCIGKRIDRVAAIRIVSKLVLGIDEPSTKNRTASIRAAESRTPESVIKLIHITVRDSEQVVGSTVAGYRARCSCGRLGFSAKRL